MQLIIRAAIREDIEAIQSIYSYYVLNGYASFEITPPDELEMLKRWRLIKDHGHPYLVAETEGVVTGYAYATTFRQRPAYNLTLENSVYVSTKHLKRGVGVRLLNQLIENQKIAISQDQADLVIVNKAVASKEQVLALEEARLGQLVGTYYIQNYNHKNELDKLTYDQVLSLAFVHLHRSDSKDYNFVQLAKGNADIAKEIYKNNHHTNPDAATLSRMEDFWPWRKQNKYVEKLAHAKSGTPSKLWIRKHCDADHTRTAAALAGKVVKTADDVIKCLRTKLIVQSGDELAARLANDSSVYVTDVTAQISASDLGVYTNWHQGLKNISGGSNYKVFESEDTYYHPSLIGYYFYRPNGATEWLQNIKDELNTNAIDYNFDELCQTIENWDVNIHTYIVDWWQDNIAGTDVHPGFNFITPPALGVAGVPTGPFNLSGGYRWDNAFINQVVKGPHQFVSQEIIVLSLSVNNPREQLQTIFHEAGGHAMHGGNWGGLHAGGVGDDKFLTQQQNTDLLTLFENYSLEQNEKYYQLAMSLGFPPSTNPVLTTFENRVFTHMPMAYFLALDLYKDFAIEDEFLARVYAMMAVNKCITFENDIWPVMKRVSPEIVGIGPHSTPIIDLALAREIDLEMKNKMKLDMRTY